ncbi:hypothetical protein EW026_g2186 [Hermanssonia centrifuga]|uniref:Cysteine protease n=1 Tax=Hermanssonia centrifuga TaxID=98765 RepID=A0A4S4KP52_9APHY|nr:hypothetical protein EW026_g2186 [Hermanssonia centrifuga]
MVDTTGNVPSAGSSSSSISEASKIRPTRSIMRSSSKKATDSRDREDKRRQSQDMPAADSPDGEQGSNDHQPRTDIADEPPVIVEPVAIPRPRTRSERPLSDNYPAVAYYPSSSSSNRISDLPSRLSGWFSHTFSTSSTDLTLPSLLSQQHLSSSTNSNSPKGKGSALLTAAKHGKGHLDKAMRYLLDSDATPDRCADSIWILGVEHPGYEPSTAPQPPTSLGRRGSIDLRRSPSSYSSSTSSSPIVPGGDPSLSQSQPSGGAVSKDPGRNWPPVFYADFTSRIWVTYRAQFIPIRDITLEELEQSAVNSQILGTSPQPKKWNWPIGGEKCWTSDAGWGCMLRTGQSLLANALLHVHLGRDWRKPPQPVYTTDYATYVQILTWFLDDPSPLCPFSVHRMALVGKQLGVKVGQWFGPSTAAGAIKTLVHAYPEAGLGVHVAADGGMIYDSEVLAASHSGIGSPRRNGRRYWGDRAVLILIGHRLGLDGVNPIYYDTLKALYTWPQSVGIAELGMGGDDLDPIQRHYVSAYSSSELKTFHCDRVRKMPLSGLDPSMLIGFLCKDEADWIDLKTRITELNRKSKATVIYLQDEPPNWPSDSEMGLESISEPDIDIPDDDDEFSDAEDHERSDSGSPDNRPPSLGSKFAEEGDTEDDPVDPVTPGIGRAAFIGIHAPGRMQKTPSTSTTSSASSGADSLNFDDEDDEEWVAPDNVLTPQQEYVAPSPVYSPAMVDSQSTIAMRRASENADADKPRRKSMTKKKSSKVSTQQYPFPATPGEDDASKSPQRRVLQMRTAKARDGGRTQSGGVRGVPVEDLDDF